MTQAAVRVRGLAKRYGEVRAVDGIDLDVHEGEVFAVLGPNGAGKSTTVEILEGYRSRDGGEVSVLGVDPGHATRAWRDRIGIVLQTAGDTAELTVRETVRHFAGYYRDPRDPDEVIAKVGLVDKAGSRLRKLSGGQRRRVDVALGVIGRPELLFLDEPTTGFDPEARRQFWDLIRDLAREGTTIMLTTHYLDEAEALAGRVAVISAGRIVAEGDPATLGGRAAADATVSWHENGERRRVATATPTRTVLELTRRFDGEVPELTVTRPTLEDVYLGLIARPSADPERTTR
ncbi:ABC transporter ATP-binding protein [Sphaerisporangium rubeum]|uniref:ABC-2 type transport system ATP-binding protein n=1 Tax=Sphaerisporangium rubeum TaxID=321317 RepID=A0A7X0M5D7_9ACTN|nr:ABC transporter ATP-binding protein [Sphaerisporangium rubeum]MBB6472280.1 ABC-2 type transport system ATP-binding protein [Sphaerisporangium rubeum]